MLFTRPKTGANSQVRQALLCAFFTLLLPFGGFSQVVVVTCDDLRLGEFDGAENEIQLAPNPFSEQFRIRTSPSNPILNLELITLQGSVVMQCSLQSTCADVMANALHASIYTLLVQTVSGKQSIKVEKVD